MHWTYAEPNSKDLNQGDILIPNDALYAVLRKVHNWFIDPKYLGFLVISQSCDLVRRDGVDCKAPYITIAAIRPLRQVLLRLLSQQIASAGGRFFNTAQKGKAVEFLNRLINQNESGSGLFYLHRDADVQLAEDAVAFLRVSIALRSDEHYASLLSARTGSLNPEFVSKLGWLCGNLYSRVGVQDWNETDDRQTQAKKIVGELLIDLDDDLSPMFIDSRQFWIKYKDRESELNAKTKAEVKHEIRQLKSQSFKDIALAAVANTLTEQNVDASVIQLAIRNLSNDMTFTKAMKPGSE